MYALIGKKLDHSFSADFFNDKFKREGIKDTYKLLPIPSIGKLKELLEKHIDLQGFNVTIPYKEEIIEFLDELDEVAAEIGAVNVVKIIREEGRVKLKGYNTDMVGFRRSLIPLLNHEIKNALILGTGGASKAVSHVLKTLGVNSLFVSRSKSSSTIIRYDDLTLETVIRNKLIVNTSPVGMYPYIHEYPQFPYDYLTDSHVCFDLIYNPADTIFLKKCIEKGAAVKNGIEMLHLQALESWKIWNV